MTAGIRVNSRGSTLKFHAGEAVRKTKMISSKRNLVAQRKNTDIYADGAVVARGTQALPGNRAAVSAHRRQRAGNSN
jgi:hypothetical protein